jgi:hypothetical protein
MKIPKQSDRAGHIEACAVTLFLLMLVGGSEQTISRILYLHCLATPQVAIIYLGRQLPGASSDQPES